MENNDVEIQMYKLLAKVKNTLGNITLLHSYLKSIQNYYLKEYEYNKNTFNDEITQIANNFLNQTRYNKLCKLLNNEELELAIAVMANELENYYICEN